MTKLKTLKNLVRDKTFIVSGFPHSEKVHQAFSDGFHCCAEETKQEAIKWAKSLPIWCKCGALLKDGYDGDLTCPIYDQSRSKYPYLSATEIRKIREDNEKKHNYSGTWEDLGKYHFIMRFFNLSEKDLK